MGEIHAAINCCLGVSKDDIIKLLRR